MCIANIGQVRIKKKSRAFYRMAHTKFFRVCFFFFSATPPYIPTVTGPDDVSNFDVFEPQKDNDLRYPDLPSRTATTTGFSGKALPFVGFTFSGSVISEEFTDRYSGLKTTGQSEKRTVHTQYLDFEWKCAGGCPLLSCCKNSANCCKQP